VILNKNFREELSRILDSFVRSKVRTTASIKMTVFSDTAQCGVAMWHRPHGGISKHL
jgi:hypothetical protein